MATVQSFNGLLRSFIDELCHTFPEDTALHGYLEGLDVLIKANVRKPMQLFMETLGPHSNLILARDPSLFDQSLSLGTIDLKTYWDSPGLSESSKDAIWQYLHTLYLLASTVSLVPADMLSAVETIAQDCAAKIQHGELDMNAVVSSMLKGDPAGIQTLLGTTDLGALGDIGELSGDLGGALEALGLGGGLGDLSSLTHMLGPLASEQLDPLAAILNDSPAHTSSSSSTRRSSVASKNKKRPKK